MTLFRWVCTGARKAGETAARAITFPNPLAAASLRQVRLSFL